MNTGSEMVNEPDDDEPDDDEAPDDEPDDADEPDEPDDDDDAAVAPGAALGPGLNWSTGMALPPPLPLLLAVSELGGGSWRYCMMRSVSFSSRCDGGTDSTQPLYLPVSFACSSFEKPLTTYIDDDEDDTHERASA